MIQEFVNRFNAGKATLREKFATEPPQNYLELVKAVVELLCTEDEYDSPDPARIEEIDWGNYQGTLLYIVGGSNYQPSTFWAIPVSYGSCSGCDTLKSIRYYSDEAPTDEQLDDYMTLALHIVQRMKLISSYASDELMPV